jgi:cytochrome c-L
MIGRNGVFARQGSLAALVTMLALAGAVDLTMGAGNGVEFRDPLTDEPLEIEPPPDASEEVKTFFATGENPYHGDEEAIAEGKQIYTRWCASCHMPDGSGRMGPSLIDGSSKYERAHTPVGQFEIIYAGATGAMQPFGDRLSAEEILKVIAYTDHLREQHQTN